MVEFSISLIFPVCFCHPCFSPFLCFFRWISKLCHDTPGVCQTLHHLPGASEISSNPGGNAGGSGTSWSGQFRTPTGRQHLWQERWLRQMATVKPPLNCTDGQKTVFTALRKKQGRAQWLLANSSHLLQQSHIIGHVLAFVQTWVLNCLYFQF